MSLKLNIYSLFSKIMISLGVFLFVLSVQFIGADFSLFVEWVFLSVNSIDFVFSVLLDWMSALFLSVVCFISGSILMYCNYYMEGEKNYLRFTYILVSFVGSMWLLIISPNLVSILLGWDGLGLTSYVLVIFYQNESSCNAGMLTVLSNRVGDVAILAGIALMAMSGGFNFYFLLSCSPFLACALILAAMTKSAQIPFSAWLPAAMAAPTPVSSLVHSSTLVTAGVYLLIRFNKHVLESGLGSALLWVGVLTMLFSGLSANFEEDMKKVVALSTLSQLGLMFMVLSLGMWKMAFFHLITHALFKSSLFMAVGFMIHNVKSSQDSRVMSSFGVSSPTLCLSLSVTNLALCGFPFLAGFYSKDLILETMFDSYQDYFLLGLIVCATGLTVSYSLRLLYKGFSVISAADTVSGPNDFNSTVVKSIGGLVLLSVSGGFIMNWLCFPYSEISVLGSFQKYWVLGIILFNGMIMFLFINWQMEVKMQLKKFSEKFFSLMWYLPKISVFSPNKQSLREGFTVNRAGDGGWLEYCGGQGGKSVLLRLSDNLQKGQASIMVSSYLLTMLAVVLLLQM